MFASIWHITMANTALIKFITFSCCDDATRGFNSSMDDGNATAAVSPCFLLTLPSVFCSFSREKSMALGWIIGRAACFVAPLNILFVFLILKQACRYKKKEKLSWCCTISTRVVNPMAARHICHRDHSRDVRSQIIYPLTALLLDRPAKTEILSRPLAAFTWTWHRSPLAVSLAIVLLVNMIISTNRLRK